MSKPYKVTITETLKMTVEVEANSRYEAEEIVSDRWHQSEYILDAESFVGVNFDAKRADRTHDAER